MNELRSSDDEIRRFEYRGYTITVDATQGDREQWAAIINIERDGTSVELNAPEPNGQYLATRREALQAGLERARYLLDKRDHILDLRNPAR
jgi:hypothetical protein